MKTLMLLCLLIVTSCASVHPGNYAEELNNKRKDEFLVSAEKVSDYSDPTLYFISITIENKSDKWLRIKSAEFSCGEECNQKVDVVVGNDLIDWAKSKREQIAIDTYNAELFRGTLAVGGLILAATSNDEGVAKAGAVVTAGAMASSAVSSMSRKSTQLESAKWVPAEHIYSPVNVPSSLFTRKWILVNHPKSFKIESFLLRLKTIDDEELTYVFSI